MQEPQSAATDPIMWLLRVTVVAGKGLPKMDVMGKSDPYVTVTFGQKKFKTRVVKKELNPTWNEEIWILVRKSEVRYDLRCDVYDWDLGQSDDYIGAIEPLDVEKFPSDGTELDQWFPLSRPSKRGSKASGSLRLKAQLFDRSSVEAEFWLQLFHHFDDDESGLIDDTELQGMLTGIGSNLSDDELPELFSVMDTNADNQLSLQELTSFVGGSHELASKMFPHDPDLIWNVTLFVRKEGGTIGEAVFHKFSVPDTSDRGTDAFAGEIPVCDRVTGQIRKELIPPYIKLAMKLMYKSKAGLALTGKGRIQSILRSLTVKQGKKYTSPKSKDNIQHFIEFHHLNTDEIADPLHSFANFNEFFYRKLKPTARPLSEPNNDAVAVSPADCRLNVFPTITSAQQLWVKSQGFSLPTLLGDADVAAMFDGGSMVIARLAPQDYHRFHSPVTGTLGDFHDVGGTYYTVNPIAVSEPAVNVYTENKRSWVLMHTQTFGVVLFVAVGATMVGSINWTVASGANVQRGDELGYFAFGGSTCLVFFQRGVITFDEDLVLNSQKPLETLVQVRTSIGKSNVVAQ